MCPPIRLPRRLTLRSSCHDHRRLSPSATAASLSGLHAELVVQILWREVTSNEPDLVGRVRWQSNAAVSLVVGLVILRLSRRTWGMRSSVLMKKTIGTATRDASVSEWKAYVVVNRHRDPVHAILSSRPVPMPEVTSR